MDQEKVYFDKVVAALRNYEKHSLKMIKQKQFYYSQLEHEKAEEAVKANYQFLCKVLSPNQLFVNSEDIRPGEEENESAPAPVSDADMDHVRTVLKQVAREWTDAGRYEREHAFKPILDEISKEYRNIEARPSTRVLVPGAGLGRLAWEIAQLGFTVQGNDFSYYHLLTANFILNFSFREDGLVTDTSIGGQMALYPYVSQSNNIIREEDQLLAVRVPDINPRNLPNNGADFSMVGGEFVEVYGGQVEEWDVVCTCFFIDTAKNIVEYIRTIKTILKPGGLWINLGPLLYHYADMLTENSIELTLEEVLRVSRQIGFEVSELGMKSCTYTSHEKSMYRTQYDCVFFTGRKPCRR